MKFCSPTYCDFAIWREDELIVERIPIDEQFLAEALEKASSFFIHCILPELLGKWYSRLPVTTSCSKESLATSQQSPPDSTWCFFQSGESGKMIACDNKDCKIIWFHVDCLKIKRTPKGTWFCPECTKSKERKSKTRQDQVWNKLTITVFINIINHLSLIKINHSIKSIC